MYGFTVTLAGRRTLVKPCSAGAHDSGWQPENVMGVKGASAPWLRIGPTTWAGRGTEPAWIKGRDREAFKVPT